jgi:hypothetical protein
MGVFNHAQRSFAAGEVSPRLHGQFGTELYEKALEACRDAQVTPQGSLMRRPGSQYKAPIATAEGCRIIPFRLQDGTDLLLELGNLTARVYDEFGKLVGVGANQLLNGGFAGLANWTVDAGDADASANALVLGCLQYRASVVTGFIHQDLVLGVAGTYEFSWTVLDRWHNGRGFGSLQVSVQQGTTVLGSRNASAPGAYNLTFQVTDTVTPVRVYFTSQHTNYDRGPTTGWYQQLFYFVIDDASVGIVGADLAIVTPWSLAQLDEVQWVSAPGQSRMYFAHPDVAPQELVFTSRLVWTLQAVVFTNAPVEWAAANYPRAIELFQGRLWLASTRQQPTQVWFSASGTVDVFGAPGSNPGDPNSFKLQTKGAVRWLKGSHYLLIGTESGEYAASGSNGVIAPGDIQVRPISGFGSAAGQAVFVGGQVVFVAGDRRKVRAADFTLERNTWQTRDLTFIAEHITKAKVAEIHYARDPNGLIVARLDDGSIAFANYSPVEQVLSWFLWRFPSGLVKRTAVMETAAGSLIWMVVQRQIDGVTQNYLEVFDVGDLNETFLDCSLRLPVNAGVIVGLGHLEGEAVQVAAGNSAVATFTVVGGQVDLGDPEIGGLASVGIAYDGTAKTLKPEGGNPRGTAQGTKRRRPRVYLRVNDSVLPLVNGERPDVAVPLAALDTPAGRQTGDFEYPGIDEAEDGQVTITMDRPFRTEVLAVFGPIQVNDL